MGNEQRKRNRRGRDDDAYSGAKRVTRQQPERRQKRDDEHPFGNGQTLHDFPNPTHGCG